MKRRDILRLLTAVGAGSTTLAGLLSTSALGDLLPGSIAAYLGIATASLLGIKEVAMVVGDYLDDGKRNKSFPAR